MIVPIISKSAGTSNHAGICAKLAFLLALLSALPPVQASAVEKEFEKLIATRCLDCHAGAEPKGGLSLESAALAIQGGESGTAFRPDDWKASLIWERVADGSMPPKSPLSDEDKEILQRGLSSDQNWPQEPIDRWSIGSDVRGGYDWWSLQPLAQLDIPSPQRVLLENDNEIDRFIGAELSRHNLGVAPLADPRTLIRRVYFDLIGLPPPYEAVDKFSKNPSFEEYQKIVDSLLESPEFGERWGRHWLDVVRYGESDGFERNYPRRDSWHYRDWVIHAINRDLPYDQFVRAQICGDVTSGDYDGVSAAGFLVAGVHNTVVGSSDRMQRIARQDELEEIIGTLGQTFLGMTVNCGRCHDHKFDPISQSNYYSFASALQGVRHGERELIKQEIESELRQAQLREQNVVKTLEQLEAELRNRVISKRGGVVSAKQDVVPAPYAEWDFEKGWNSTKNDRRLTPSENARIENGKLILDGKSFAASELLNRNFLEKTLVAVVELDNLDQKGGGIISLQTKEGRFFDAIVFGERDPKQWMAGSDLFERTKSFAAPQEAEANTMPVHIAIVYRKNGEIEAFRNGVPYGRKYKSNGPRRFEAKTGQILIGLRHSPAVGDRLLSGKVDYAAIYDRALSDKAIQNIAKDIGVGVSDEEIQEVSSVDEQRELQKLRDELHALEQEVAGLTNAQKVKIYSVTPTPNPGVTKVLKRGDVYAEGAEVKPMGLQAIQGLSAEFGLTADSSDVERRVALANWITNKQNPLFARVIVNRIWHYHFGVGIVDTPNDFGFNGGRPSHPQLLDWLANDLIRNEFRLKPLHKKIVMSYAYRQASVGVDSGKQVDAQNRLLWRGPTRRLEAEAIRDSMLKITGKLNSSSGGPGFVDVEIADNNGTTYYFPKEVDGPEFFKRTVYRFSPRCERSPLLDTFDCPDPSATAPKRTVTTTPLQALSLLNNEFVLRMSDYLAVKVKETAGDDIQQQVEWTWKLSVGREPDSIERELSLSLIREHGLVALCRGLFNSNDFVIVQ